jgi:hypothetical protein
MRYLKNNFRGRAGERIPHDFLNTLANFWNDLTVVGGTLNRRSDGRKTTIEIDATGGATAAFDYSILQHGFSVADGNITLKTGDVKLYGAYEVATPENGFSLEGTQYFYVHYDRGGSSEWRVAGAKPGATQTSSIDVFFYKFYEGVLQNVGHLGDINLDLPLA